MKVFITGTGAISSLGNTVDSMFEGLLRGDSAVRSYPDWAQYKGLKCHLGAPVSDYDVMKLPRQVRRSMSRMSEMAALASFQALQQADISLGEKLNTPRTLICMGSTTGSPWALEAYFHKLFEKHGPEGQLSTSFFKVMNHSVAANVAAACEFNGALLSPSSACSTSTQAIILGWELIKAGLYDVVIAGGADELHFTSAAVFDVVQAASHKYNDKPDVTPRPFDKDRDGLVVSEGAGVVILESEAHALKRGAKALAEVRGGSYLCDGTHMSQSNASTMAKTMQEALIRAGMKASEVEYVNAHATGTHQGDSEEAAAIFEIFGKDVPVSSLKGHMGHSLAACGALEAIASIQMIKKNVLIPTRNLVERDPQCAPIHLFKENMPTRMRSVLSNNFAFGGMNTSLLLSAVY